MSNTPSAIQYREDLGPNVYGQPVTFGLYAGFTYACGHRSDATIGEEGTGLESRAKIISKLAKMERVQCPACNQLHVDDAEAAEERRTGWGVQ